MRDLADFIESHTNQKIDIFEYKNQDLKPNQELITFNNSLYIIETKNQDIDLNLNNYFYLIHQPNLDYFTLKNILYNLYEDITLIDYKNKILVASKIALNIDMNSIDVIESETYRNTYILDIGLVKDKEILDLSIDLYTKLLPTIVYNDSKNKYISSKDLILYRNIDISSKDNAFLSLVNFEKIKNLDDNLIYTGISFIENDLNIARTSSSLFLHRNTLIYRLEKIKENLNLDLKTFKDAMIFYLSIKTYFTSKK